MSTALHPSVRAEFRTPAQIAADEELADAYDRDEFSNATVLLTEEGAKKILAEAVACMSRLEAHNGDQVVAMGLGQPFRWKENVYRIVRAAFLDGKAEVEVTPADAEFEAEVKRRIQNDRFHVLSYYQGFGFICFPEDHTKYQNN